MSDAIREAFDVWADRYDHDTNEWEDMGRDDVFAAGYRAALQSSQTAPAVPVGWRQALHDAVSAIYFDDSSDFGSTLWSVVGSLSPELAGILESDPSAAWHKSQAMLDAPQPDHYPDAGKALPVAIPDSEFDETDPIHQAADAYSYACEIMEQCQTERVEAGKEPGTTGSLCDGIAWLYQRIQELENHYPDAGKVVQESPAGWIWDAYGSRNFTAGTHHKNVLEADGVTLTPVYTHPAESREETHKLGQQLYDAARFLGCAQAGGNPDAAEHWSSKAEAILARLRASQQEGGEG